jgi:hypothetical protein
MIYDRERNLLLEGIPRKVLASERPQLIPAFIEDKSGHILPYVKFEGGSLTIADQTINVLNQL